MLLSCPLAFRYSNPSRNGSAIIKIFFRAKTHFLRLLLVLERSPNDYKIYPKPLHSSTYQSQMLRCSWRQFGDTLRTCHGKVIGRLLPCNIKSERLADRQLNLTPLSIQIYSCFSGYISMVDAVLVHSRRSRECSLSRTFDPKIKYVKLR